MSPEPVVEDGVEALTRSTALFWELLHAESFVKDYTAAIAAERWVVAAETAWIAARACAVGFCRFATGRTPAPEFVREATRAADPDDELGLLALLDGVGGERDEVLAYCDRVDAARTRVASRLPFPAYRYPEDGFKILSLGRSLIETQDLFGVRVFDEVAWMSPS